MRDLKHIVTVSLLTFRLYVYYRYAETEILSLSLSTCLCLSISLFLSHRVSLIISKGIFIRASANTFDPGHGGVCAVPYCRAVL